MLEKTVSDSPRGWQFDPRIQLPLRRETRVHELEVSDVWPVELEWDPIRRDQPQRNFDLQAGVDGPVVQLVSVAGLADALQINRATAFKIAAAGLAGPRFKAGNGEFFDARIVYALAEMPTITEGSSHALFLRSDSVRLNDEYQDEYDSDPQQDFIGWMTPDRFLKLEAEAELGWRAHEGVERWWRVPNPAEQIGKPVVVLIGPLVAAIYSLTGYTKRADNLRWLRLGEPSEASVRAFGAKRVYLPPGPNVVAW